MARPKALDYEDKKLEILRAAAVMFAKKGYNETLLDDIAEQCGIGKSSLYHYHRSKHAILYGLIKWKIEDLAWKVDAAVEAADTPEQQLQAMTTTLVNEYLRVPDEVTVLLTMPRHLNATAKSSISQIQHRIINRMVLIAQALRPDLEVSRKKLTAMAMLYFGMTNWIHVWYKPSGSIKASELAAMIVRVFLDGVNGLSKEQLA
ncbi:MAG TPA: TetR/AcrR family transcriptional regulator [Pusillimonas sp.]|uniref:TetR/AcrR family transcriptional regulator n=1 Tax=Pusillimonas sp. TaxID=3040095 RepID=UPI002CCD6BBE|nr:TetR/AcrR family transcriptional regulator [Pusillimonas sp.]HUH87672.1 TetR/AcrR family transcriptional regulator [Pusillimonas sp.]